jgi:hypothetical protein
MTRRRTRSATTAAARKAHANSLRASPLPMPPFLLTSHQPPSGPVCDLCHDIGAVQHFCNLLIKHVKEHVNANLTTMYAQSDGCKAQFKNTTHYLWISEQYEKTGIRADWTFFCSCHGKCDCDPEGGACKNVVKLHQLRDSAQNRTIINNIDELAAFLEANFKNPTKSYFAKKGGGAIYQRHIHYVKASEIEVTRRDLVHAEYSLKKSDCYRQICDIGEPGVVVCRHRSCHQCRHDHEDEVGGDCIDLDFARCKEEAHCGAPQERALTAVQFEQDEVAMEFRALALQEQARRIQSGEIVCVANHDVETKSCLPFLIGKVCQTRCLRSEIRLLNQSAICAQLSMALSIDVTTLIIGDWRVV